MTGDSGIRPRLSRARQNVCAPCGNIAWRWVSRVDAGNPSAVRAQTAFCQVWAAIEVQASSAPGVVIIAVTSRVARGRGHGVIDGFERYSQRFRKSSAGCLMLWSSVRTSGLASKYSCTWGRIWSLDWPLRVAKKSFTGGWVNR